MSSVSFASPLCFVGVLFVLYWEQILGVISLIEKKKGTYMEDLVFEIVKI